MKKKIAALFKLFVLLTLLMMALLAIPEKASAGENPVIWKHQVKGDFAVLVGKI